jgi:hypothetical protein
MVSRMVARCPENERFPPVCSTLAEALFGSSPTLAKGVMKAP